MPAAGVGKAFVRARLSAFDYFVLAGAGVNALVIGCLLVYAVLGR